MHSLKALFAAGLTLFALTACSSSDDPSDNAGGGGGNAGAGEGGGGGGSGEGGGPGPAPGCFEPTAVPCEDQVILGMNLQDDVAPGAVRSEPDGAGFRSFVDATAGGAFTPDPDSYVYARFTETGLEKVEISDEASLTSMDWDISLRRYVVRINSGHSGPSCVNAARLPGTPIYDELAAVPDGLRYRVDEYFTDSCEIIPDGSGLENSPATALSGYWSYPGCVAMTGNVYVLALANGKRLKLTVESYYKPDAQEQCDTTNTVPMADSGAASFQIRWAFLP
jgi:HmuY protein